MVMLSPRSSAVRRKRPSSPSSPSHSDKRYLSDRLWQLHITAPNNAATATATVPGSGTGGPENANSNFNFNNVGVNSTGTDCSGYNGYNGHPAASEDWVHGSHYHDHGYDGHEERKSSGLEPYEPLRLPRKRGSQEVAKLSSNDDDSDVRPAVHKAKKVAMEDDDSDSSSSSGDGNGSAMTGNGGGIIETNLMSLSRLASKPLPPLSLPPSAAPLPVLLTPLKSSAMVPLRLKACPRVREEKIYSDDSDDDDDDDIADDEEDNVYSSGAKWVPRPIPLLTRGAISAGTVDDRIDDMIRTTRLGLGLGPSLAVGSSTDNSSNSKALVVFKQPAAPLASLQALSSRGESTCSDVSNTTDAARCVSNAVAGPGAHSSGLVGCGPGQATGEGSAEYRQQQQVVGEGDEAKMMKEPVGLGALGAVERLQVQRRPSGSKMSDAMMVDDDVDMETAYLCL